MQLIGMGVDCWLRTQHGRPILSWRRPPKAKVDKSRRLLATGRYADQEAKVPRLVAPDPKRGFPQPPVDDKQKRKRADSDRCHDLEHRAAPKKR
jgi:hypothetical protein